MQRHKKELASGVTKHSMPRQRNKVWSLPDTIPEIKLNLTVLVHWVQPEHIVVAAIRLFVGASLNSEVLKDSFYPLVNCSVGVLIYIQS